MYESSGAGQMGCSVNEISGLGSPNAAKLKELIGKGITLCVTSSWEKSAHTALEEAGFIKLVDYPNYASFHNGNRCILWMATKKNHKSVVILPDKKKKKR
jgi:hypothetical protein